MTSDLGAAVLDEAWPCPEVSVHSGYTYRPGRHLPPSPTKDRYLQLRPLLTRGGQCCPETGATVALYLCHLVLAPEAGIVEWCVSVLVDCIWVGFALNQLDVEKHVRGTVKKTKNINTVRI